MVLEPFFLPFLSFSFLAQINALVSVIVTASLVTWVVFFFAAEASNVQGVSPWVFSCSPIAINGHDQTSAMVEIWFDTGCRLWIDVVMPCVPNNSSACEGSWGR